MIPTYKDGKFVIKAIIISFFVLFIIGYSTFQAHKLISGPQVSVYSPISGEVATSSEVSVTGQAKNISFISLNDRPIFVDQSGNFNEKLLLYPGYNIIKILAKDKFGAIAEKKIDLIYKQ